MPPHKTPPAAKTADEFAAYNAAVGNPDTPAAEKAADDFAQKYAQSDLRGLLYSNIMRRYQQANDSDKTLEMARKVLTYQPNDPVALVMAATVLAERTREGDLDRDERYDEAIKYAQRALETTKEAFESRGRFVVYLGLPLWFDARANCVSPGQSVDARAKILYRVVETEVADENTGENSKAMLQRRRSSSNRSL